MRVPFGERELTGVVTGPGEEPESGLRDVAGILDEEPVCPPELLQTAERIARRFFTGAGEVLKAALPARLPAGGAVRYRITEKGAFARSQGPEAEILERLSSGEAVRAVDLPGRSRQEAVRALEERGWIRAVSSFTPRRTRIEKAYSAVSVDPAERSRRIGRSRRAAHVLDFLVSAGRPATAAELRVETGASSEVLRDLEARGLLRGFEQRARDAPRFASRGERARVVLSADQSAALSEIASALSEHRYFPALLQGVTGSGKTEIYLRAIARAVALGRTAIWLVPEIALTPVFARELAREFGERAAVLHSALSEKERAESWDRVRSGAAPVVIGPRSAVFAPVENLGLVVVDEEHDASYKQRESPRYDAREVAALRARAWNAALLFGTATPSLEALHAAREGRLARLLLKTRVDDRPLPTVEVVDLRREPWRADERGIPLFSPPLVARLREAFSRGEQAILLQPRRGFAPFLLCRDCGFEFRCTRCSVARTVHERGRRLVCHYCGERVPRPARCPDCGGSILEAIGAGTERVADRFGELFPGVPFAVLDRDTARRRGAESVIEEISSGRAQCLIGTQMVAKGHDFPGVTAVGVLTADTLLNFPDFRAAEKTFQLLAQVAGRAGRGERPGTVHVQTFHPNHPAIRSAAMHDVEGFADQELAFRRSFFYPPYSELAGIVVSSRVRERAEEAAGEIGVAARAAAGLARLSGPAPAPLERLAGRWRQQILIRAEDRRSVLQVLEACVPERPPAGVQIAVDVDPQDLM